MARSGGRPAACQGPYPEISDRKRGRGTIGALSPHVQQPLTSPLPEGLERNLTVRQTGRTLRRSAAIVAAVATAALLAGTFFVQSSGLMQSRDHAPGVSPFPALDPAPGDIRREDSAAGTDELQRLLDDTENRARAVYKEIYSHINCIESDAIGEQCDTLSRELTILEHEMLSTALSTRSP